MAKVKISFGLNSVDVDVPEGTTVGDLLGNANYKAVLGFTDNVAAKIGGVSQPTDMPVRSGDSIVLETRANSKA